MGNSIVDIKKSYAYRKNTSSLLHMPLSKLSDFHATFKSICDNFSMDLTEFEQIFGSNESAFVIWDTDNNGLVDSLELFSGLAMFSDSKNEDKIRFLFDLFDLNELESLAAIDIEFMIYSCISATYKIYSMNTEIDSEDIATFVYKQINPDARLTVTTLLKISKESPEIQEFFKLVKSENSSNFNTAGLNKMGGPPVSKQK